MRTLWIFGDSFSESWEGVLQRRESHGQWQYCDWLKRKPHHFSETIQEIVNNTVDNPIDKTDIFGQPLSKQTEKITHIRNYGLGGFDNYSILETIGYHIPEIQKNDMVMIGWSAMTRWRFLGSQHAKIMHLDGWTERNHPAYSKAWQNCNAEWGWEFEPKKYHKFIQEQPAKRIGRETVLEVERWQNILKLALPKDTVFWTPFNLNFYERFYPNEDWYDYKNLPFEVIYYWTHTAKASSEKAAFAYGTPQRIQQHTKGVLSDRHYSENGHISVGKRLVAILSYQNREEYSLKKKLF